jgi:hypothetical protein
MPWGRSSISKKIAESERRWRRPENIYFGGKPGKKINGE